MSQADRPLDRGLGRHLSRKGSDYATPLSWRADSTSSRNLHRLNRCHDPKLQSVKYGGHIPYIRTENLVGASHGKTQLAAFSLRNPVLQYHFNPHLFQKIKVEPGDKAMEAAAKRAESARLAAEAMGTRPTSTLRIQASNDATGRAPAHYGSELIDEIPWAMPDEEEWRRSSNLMHAVTKPASGKDPLERNVRSPCSLSSARRLGSSRLKDGPQILTVSSAGGTPFSTSLSAGQKSLEEECVPDEAMTSQESLTVATVEPGGDKQSIGKAASVRGLETGRHTLLSPCF